MLNFLCEDTTANAGNNILVYVILIGFLLALIVLPMFTQRRRNREYEAMINSLSVGDLVKTAGGIIGRIKSITNKGELKTVILETGSKTEKSYMEFDMNMIACVLKSTKIPTETEKVVDVDVEEDEDDELDEEVETPVEKTENVEVVTEKTEEPEVNLAETIVEEKKAEEKPKNTKQPIKTTAKTTNKSSVKKNKK